MSCLPSSSAMLSLTLLAWIGLAGCGKSEQQTSLDAAPQGSRALVRMPSAAAIENAERPGIISPAIPDHQVAADANARKLFDSLVSPSDSQRDWEQTFDQLLAEGEAATRVLAQKLVMGSEMERELAATMLALLGSQAASASQELVMALQDQLPFVQANAAATLVQLPGHAQKAIPTLTQLLLAEDPQLRQLAAVNLNAAGVLLTEHVVPLRLALQQENTEEVLTPVVELLGRIGRPAEMALPELKKIAGEQSGELGAAATSAIELISGEVEFDSSAAR